ncbi:type II secretion system GspH family protein [Leptolyngbya sp. Heron Island J]|uniref:type II secretion system GspH family protein n=1 Tax=Leptolyngbya sp. Heron Island J TaxID=1385935 RepID=UPI001F3EE2E7|nr:type II secretion system GspH family protein [Leptolyngbya sp. Heron Island J]
MSSVQSYESGLTLLEGVVAIAVIGISVAVMTPMVVLAVGTRIQSQRAEQAFQIAQAEVDRIKLIVERGGDYTLNIAPTPAAVLSQEDFDDFPVPAPDSIADDYPTDVTSARGIDVDNDGDDDYAVQIFKTEGITVDTRPVAFDLGVRVYRADVVNGDPLEVEQARLTITSGEGQSANRPLANIYTSIVKSDTEQSLCDYYDFINDIRGTTVPAPSDC